MAARIDRMQKDVNELALKIFEDFLDLVQNPVLEDSSLRFEVKVENEWKEISICFNEDYPENTVICGLDGVDSNRLTAEEAFMAVVNRLKLSSNEDRSVSCSADSTELATCQSVSTSKKSRMDSPMRSTGISDDSDTDHVLATEERENHKVSHMSTGSASFQDQDYHLDPIEVNAALHRDMDECREIMGAQSCSLVHQNSLDSADIYMNIPVEVLPENMASAWGIDSKKPVRVQLSDISVTHYRRTNKKPDAKVYQGSPTEKAGICLKQLRMIINKFLSKHWKIADESDYAKGCIFVNLYIYARERLPTLCDYCVICDARHELTAMFMPSICSRDLCVFSYETMGVMAEFDARCNSHIEVMDLLMKMFIAAASSARRELILVPYPSVADPSKHDELAFSDSSKDFGKILTVCRKLPCARTIREMTEEGREWLAELQKRDLLLYPLIRWTFVSNRTYLKKLAESDLLPFFNTKHQYLMVLDSPAKEAVFREAKKQHGESIFAFHGSPFENWHSILRRGLINSSGTNLQIHGAAHGKGIYISPHSNVSIGYSLKTSTIAGMPLCETPFANPSHDCTENGRFLGSKTTYACIALCEVVPTASLRRPSSQIWVLEDPNLICTRFFLVYDKGLTAAEQVDCTNAETLQKIRTAVEKHCRVDQ